MACGGLEFPHVGTTRVCSSFTGDRFRDSLVLLLIDTLVRCPVCYFLALPLKSCIRRDILWLNPSLRHELETLACIEGTSVCGWSHPPHLRDGDGWNPEFPQLDHKQYRRARLQLVGGHAGSTPGIFHLGSSLPCVLRRDRNPWNSSTLATTKPGR